jgi:hypothetical protein
MSYLETITQEGMCFKYQQKKVMVELNGFGSNFAK